MWVGNNLYKSAVTEHRKASITPMWKLGLLLTVMLAVPGVTLACPTGMVLIDDQYCIDSFEGSLDQNSPAVPIAGVLPTVNISQTDASLACQRAAKRLCTDAEWRRACQGPSGFIYPYGNNLVAGQCNDQGSISIAGEYSACITAEGAYDMVGNVGEWTDDPDGTFRGGFFSDIAINGFGCNYVTKAHSVSYSDDKTGFRCCSDDTQPPSTPTLSCVGFEPPMDKTVSVKKNRVLPLKMELRDEYGAAITNFDISAPPIVEVNFDGAAPATEPEDAYLPAGQGDVGNQFVFSGSKWQFNLKTKNFSGSGTYTIKGISGDPGEYIIGSLPFRVG